VGTDLEDMGRASGEKTKEKAGPSELGMTGQSKDEGKERESAAEKFLSRRAGSE